MVVVCIRAKRFRNYLRPYRREIDMSVDTDLNTNIEQLTKNALRLEGENANLRDINSQMLAALNGALPVLRDGVLPESVNFDKINAAVVKVQNAIAAAERDH